DGFITLDYNDELAVGDVLHSLMVTIYYVLGRVPITIALAFVLAFFLFIWIQRGRTLLRTAYFLPYVTNSAALALVFAFIFNARLGIVNAMLERFGMPTFLWLDDPFPFLLRLFPWIPGIENVDHVWLGPSVAMMVIIF